MEAPDGGMDHSNCPVSKERRASIYWKMFALYFSLGAIAGLIVHNWVHECPIEKTEPCPTERTGVHSLVKNTVELCSKTMKSKLHIVKNESEDTHLVYEILSCCLDETKNGCFQASPPTIIFHHRAPNVERK